MEGKMEGRWGWVDRPMDGRKEGWRGDGREEGCTVGWRNKRMMNQ